MCGIGVVINYGESKINLLAVENMFKNMEERGDDASGIYYERLDENGKLFSRVFKAPVAPIDLWNSVQGKVSSFDLPECFKDKWKLNGTERLIMLHTRTATRGPVKDNNNNMPIYGKKWVLIHNGIINAQKLPNYKYSGHVDSEELLARLETTDDVMNSIESVSGSMAICARPMTSDHLFMYRNTNPLCIITSEKSAILYACSKKGYVLNPVYFTVEEKKEIFPGEMEVFELAKETLYKIGTVRPDIEQVATMEDTPFSCVTEDDQDERAWRLIGCRE